MTIMLLAASLLLTSCFIAISESQQPPIMSPTRAVVFIGQPVVLSCTTDGTTPIFQWLADGAVVNVRMKPTIYTVKHETESNVTRLIINSTTPQNSGRYVCQTNYYQSDAVPLAVLDVNINASSAAVSQGDNIKLVCNLVIYNALPLIDVTVSVSVNDNNGIVLYQNTTTFNSNTSLEVNTVVSSTNNVQYFCTAVYENTSKQANTSRLQVSYPVRNVSINVTDGCTVQLGDVLLCSAEAVPAASFMWQQYFNNTGWMNISSGSTYIIQGDNNSSNITLRCTAWNIVRDVTYNASSVGLQIELSPNRPCITSTTRSSLYSVTGASIIDGDQSNGNTKRTVGLIDGLTVGLGVPFIVVAILLVVCCYKRRHRSAEKPSTNSAIYERSRAVNQQVTNIELDFDATSVQGSNTEASLSPSNDAVTTDDTNQYQQLDNGQRSLQTQAQRGIYTGIYLLTNNSPDYYNMAAQNNSYYEQIT